MIFSFTPVQKAKHKRELEGRPWSPEQADGWHFYTFIQLNAPFYWTMVDHSMTSHRGQIIFYSEPRQFWSGMLRGAAPGTMS